MEVSSPPTEMREFCPGCFADDRGGSWGGASKDGYCSNCGAMGTVHIPTWAVKSIRQQASWVGKRYYPSEEDLSMQRELEFHRERAGVPASRRASLVRDDEEGLYLVTQILGTDPRREVCITIRASSQEEAIRLTKKRLPWPVPSQSEG